MTGKIQGSYMEPMQERKVVDFKFSLHSLLESLRNKLESVLFRRGFVLFIFGFMLGRAFILSVLSPFSLPFFAAAYYIRKDKSPLIFFGIVAGSLTISITNALYSFMIISLFLVLNKIVKWFTRNESKILPFIVLASVLLGRIVWSYATVGDLTIYNALMATVEAGLAFVLTMIFMQSIPLLSMSKRRQALKTEELVCLIILIASMMTGAMGWAFEEVTVANILARYLVLIFAFTAGATVGSTVGVVTGLIFGLADINSFPEMSLLAFSGLLGGLLKEGKKAGTIFGLIVATLLLGLYSNQSGSIMTSLYETLLATIIFILTPRLFTSQIAKHIPGTSEHSAEQQAYVRKIRDATARRVEQFSSIFHALATSFQKQEAAERMDPDMEVDYFFANVTAKTCQTCFKKEKCWAANGYNKTYDTMKSIMYELEENNGVLSNKTVWDWERRCVRSDKVIDTIQNELHYFHADQKLQQQIKESRKLVAEQLHGVSEVMANFAKEIQKERENHEKQEDQLLDALQSFGIEVDHIEIYNLDQGNVDIDITIPYCSGMGQCEKLIAPLLSDILGEQIVVYSEECGKHKHDYCYATFRSAKRFVVETGIAYAAKNGGFVSGDSYTTIEIGAGKYALAISDGMGNGERAYLESKETLALLEQILQSGIDEEIAIKSINSILSLRTTDEVYATLDLAIVDLQDAQSKFIKVGSTPSFIKRGDRVIKIQASNLPIGIIQDFEVDVVSEQLKAGDLLIMMSDGIFEGPRHIENMDLWLKRKILELETDDPQAVADIIMEEVIRSSDGYIDDDMTVLVAKINHNNPKWKPIPAISLRKGA
ncbi:stage II sporulation protein E [Bacillus andreraoultii]|uniref:stage II sporulation protein E n=1 Tax=Bacillus andreraoultii TaxID=1499685 RepID=UPI00053AD66B